MLAIMKTIKIVLFFILTLAQVTSLAQDKKAKSVVYGDIPDYKEYYLSPDFIKSAGEKIAISCRTGKALVILDNGKTKKISLSNFTSGLDITKDGKIAFVSLYQPNGKLLKIDLDASKVIASVDIDHFPRAVTLSDNGKFAFVANQFKNEVRKIDTAKMQVVGTAKAIRDPFAVGATKDGNWLVIVNQLPEAKGGLYEENISAAVNLVDAKKMQTIATINLPNGAINAQDVAISPDDKYAYVTHIVARFNVPTTQVERGWINTNAVSVIDIKNKKLLATVLIDDIELGAANPYGIIVAENGKKLVVAQSGSHEICVIDRIGMHKKINMAYKNNKDANKVFEDICNDLSFLSGMKKRIPLKGFGPRHLCEANGKIIVALYYSDVINTIDLNNNQVKRFSIGGNEKLNEIRRGDLFYHDASLCFQKWLSCITCHTEVRSDALNWDLLNDGIGNPKQSKSMLFSHFTPPSMITGVREHAYAAVRKGIRYIQFTRRPERDAVAIDKYLMSLRPIPSPYLDKTGNLSESALNGEFLFEQAKCNICHNGEYFTDMKKHDVDSGLDEYKGFKFDTPTLREVWRTAPYLYDGRAKSVFDMLKIHNKSDKHGKTSNLSDKDLRDLEQYILTL